MTIAIAKSTPRWHPQTEIEIDGISVRLLAWEEQPENAPIVLLVHGMEEHSETWVPLCQRLGQDYRIYGLDLPWSGQQGYRWGHIRSAVDWLQLGLKLLPSPPAICVAHSFGANTVLEYLHHVGPGSLEAAVLVSPYYRSRFDLFDWSLFHHSLQCFRSILEQGLRVRRGKRDLSPQMLNAMTDKVMDYIGPHGFMEFFTMFARSPALDLSRIQIPILIMGGLNDCGSMPAENMDLSLGLPNSSIELLSGCGHFCMLEHPGTTADLIHRFLAKVDGRKESAG